MKGVIVFNMKEGLTYAEEEAIIDQITSIAEVEVAQRLKASSQEPTVRRMYIVYLLDNAHIAEVVQQLSSLKNVESVSIPSDRSLLT